MSNNEIRGVVHGKNHTLFAMLWRLSPENDETLFFQNRAVTILRKPHKRSIGLILQLDGRIGVTAPQCTPLSTIREFLQANTNWIESHLSRYQALREAHPLKTFEAGEAFDFMGDRFRLRIGGDSVAIRGDEIFVPDTQSTGERREAVIAFYKREGVRHMRERLQYFAGRMGVSPTATRFASQKTRWGSCSASGTVSLNWRTIIAPPDAIDYVIIHELAHLKHYNHSEEFWALVEKHSPQWKEWRRWFCEHEFDADFLAKYSELHPPS